MNDIRIAQVTCAKEKEKIARAILEALTEWFELEAGREEYISGSAEMDFFAAFDGDTPVGFLCLKQTGRDAVELAVTGVLKEYHRKGVGRAMFESAREHAKKQGFSFMQVKTVKSGVYEEYDLTNLAYRAWGFKELEVIPAIWGEDNPCQIYVMYLG